MANNFVGAQHEFHSKEFALGWADRFVPTPERMRLFELIFSEIKERVPENGIIIELGMGPGYLANYLLDRMPDISYFGIDFSLPMIEIAQSRLQAYSSRVTYIQSDLVKDAWEDMVPEPVDAIVSTWALHDLGSPDNIKMVYESSYKALNTNSILINGDFIKPNKAIQEFEGGRFYVSKHLELLDDAGFIHPVCLSLFEEEIENPTPAQNYACIRADK